MPALERMELKRKLAASHIILCKLESGLGGSTARTVQFDSRDLDPARQRGRCAYPDR